MRARISGLSTLCKRFAAVLRRCDVESFLNIGRMYPEIAPMEKRLDMHINLLRRDEFREMECVSDIVKYALRSRNPGILFLYANHTTGYRHNSTISLRPTSMALNMTWANGNWAMCCPLTTISTCLPPPLALQKPQSQLFSKMKVCASAFLIMILFNI